jgi:hypothetical protein
MSSSTTLILSAILGVLGGTSVAAWLTGWLTIRQKRLKRVQKRRADAYVETLVWIRWGMTLISTGKEIPDTVAVKSGSTDIAVAGSAEEPASPGSKADSPYTVATTPENAGPNSEYHAALRARIVAFGSHDMCRAFDRWSEAYRMVAAKRGDDACHVDSPDSDAHAVLKRLTYKEAIVTDRVTPGTTKPSRRFDRGFPDGKDGCLTRAIECCASWELRKG